MTIPPDISLQQYYLHISGLHMYIKLWDTCKCNPVFHLLNKSILTAALIHILKKIPLYSLCHHLLHNKFAFMAPLHCTTKLNHEITETSYCGLKSFLQDFSKVTTIMSYKYIIFPPLQILCYWLFCKYWKTVGCPYCYNYNYKHRPTFKSCDCWRLRFLSSGILLC